MATLVLTVIGDDRSGLVSALSGVIAEHGGSWERSQMARLAGKFAGVPLEDTGDRGAERRQGVAIRMGGRAEQVDVLRPVVVVGRDAREMRIGIAQPTR